jgi:hypothetical protein
MHAGYDMEDAMILNKSSMERGLCHGTLYKTEMIDLREEHKGQRMMFSAEPHDNKTRVGDLVQAAQSGFAEAIQVVSTSYCAPLKCTCASCVLFHGSLYGYQSMP